MQQNKEHKKLFFVSSKLFQSTEKVYNALSFVDAKKVNTMILIRKFSKVYWGLWW